MRRLTIIALFMALLWSGYWGLGVLAAQQVTSKAVNLLGKDGWTIEQAGLETKGFPSEFRAYFQTVAAHQTSPPTALNFTGFEVATPSYWPWVAEVSTAELDVALGLGDAQIALSVQQALIESRLRSGLDLELKHLALTTKAIELRTAGAFLAKLAEFDLGFSQSLAGEGIYTIEAEAHDLTPGPRLRNAVAGAAEFPPSFTTVQLHGQIAFRDPLSRHDLARPTPPRPESIKLQKLKIVWGDVALTGRADFSFDPHGQPEGTADLKVANWRAAFQLLKPLVSLPPAQLQQVEFFLAALARRESAGDDLILPIRVHDGQISLSGIPIGTIPRLFQRQ